MPSETVLLKGKKENRFIFAKREDYNKGKRRKDEKGYWTQYEIVKSLEMPEPLSEVLTSNKTGYTLKTLTELMRGIESSMQKLKTPINAQIDKMYEEVRDVELIKSKPGYL